MAFCQLGFHRLLELGASQAAPGRCCPLWPLGTLAAAAALLLGLGERDGAGQGDGTDGAARHLSAGHLLLDGWRWTKEKWVRGGVKNQSVGEFKGMEVEGRDATGLPVRTSMNAASTLVESSADVSMNMRPFFSACGRKEEKVTSDVKLSSASKRTVARGPVSWLSPAKARASSVGTVRRLSRSLLLPTSITTMWVSPCSYSSFSQRSALSYVRCLLMS